jgi:hypothetical protein
MRTIKWSDEVKFQPWVQRPYWNQEVRTLVLGDSHYGADARAANADFTTNMVNELAIKKPIAFFTRSAALIENAILANESDRRAFWESVAFYNYLQQLAGETAGVPVAYEPFGASASAFREVLRKLKPNLVIVLGHRVWRHMDSLDARKDKAFKVAGVDERYLEAWRYSTSDGNEALVFHVKHPSRGFSFGKFHPLYLHAIKRLASTSA